MPIQAFFFALVLLPLAPVLRAQVHIVGASNTPVREFYDPTSGGRWLLYRSENGGPGRLVWVANPETHRGSSSAASIPLRSVIRAGDRIVLEEHTATVDAVLQATALGSAAPGGELRVRLDIGGRIVPAIARAAGRAEIASNRGPQP